MQLLIAVSRLLGLAGLWWSSGLLKQLRLHRCNIGQCFYLHGCCRQLPKVVLAVAVNGVLKQLAELLVACFLYCRLGLQFGDFCRG